jgi:glycosyltransferase involved in cell wall biosynthesis
MSPSQPTVSVIITTHARPRLVLRAAASALAQTLRDIEVIVVVDGPSTATLEALQTMQDERLSLHITAERSGQAAAINRGVELARGRWTALLDDDDEWLPKKLETQLKTALSSSRAMPVVGCQFLARGDEGDLLWPARRPGADERICDYLFCRSRLAFGEGVVPTSMLFAPTELFRQVPMMEIMPKHCDLDWLLRVDLRQDAGLELPADPGPLAIWNLGGSDRLSNIHDWRYSCQWIDGLRVSITPEAYAGFLLTWVSFSARIQGDIRAIPRLLFKAFHLGRPSLKAVVVYAAVWCLPFGVRNRWSNALIAQPGERAAT